MIVRLVTSWDLDPRAWAATFGCDERSCGRELMHYLSDAISTLPMYDENPDIVPRDSDPSRLLPDELDGRTRFLISWAIEVRAESWRQARSERDPVADTPVQRTAHHDVALSTARELYGLPQVCETDAVMRVLHPFTGTYTPDQRSSRN